MKLTVVRSGVRLRDWVAEHEPGDTMFWRDAFWCQVDFMSNEVSPMLAAVLGVANLDLCKVTGQHRSKSIWCPVYHFDLPGLKLWARCNFCDWNVSVEAARPVVADFLDTFCDEHGYGYCFVQGMEDRKFPRYRDDPSRFTVCIPGHYDAYVFFRVLAYSVKRQRAGEQP